MKKSSLRSFRSIEKVSILISFILLAIFWVAITHAQFLFPSQPDYLSLYALSALSSPIPQYPIGFPLQVPLNNMFESQTINTGLYPNATYFSPTTISTLPRLHYTTNATGYYTIESASCTCNLP